LSAHSRWKTTTFLPGLRHDRIAAPCLFDGPINGERLLAHVEQVLVHTLQPAKSSCTGALDIVAPCWQP